MSNLTGFVKRLRDIMRNDAGINGDAQRIEQIVWLLFLKVYDAKEQDWEFEDEGYESIIPENCRWQNWAVDDKSGAFASKQQGNGRMERSLLYTESNDGRLQHGRGNKAHPFQQEIRGTDIQAVCWHTRICQEIQ